MKKDVATVEIKEDEIISVNGEFGLFHTVNS
jgi:hypothetical protein